MVRIRHNWHRKDATLPYFSSPSVQPTFGDVKKTVEWHTLQIELRRAKLLAQDWLTKKEACEIAGVARATWDRARKKKREGHPDYADFPEDYRPSGNPDGHLRFKVAQIVAWANRTIASKKVEPQETA